MKYLEFIKINLKSFNIIKYSFYTNKLSILNYILFFLNLKQTKIVLIQIKLLISNIKYLMLLKKKLIDFLISFNKSFLFINLNFLKFYLFLKLFNLVQLRLESSDRVLNLELLNFKKQFQFISSSSLKLNLIKFPVKLKKYTILKSPHIFKKFRDHYQINNYSSSFFLVILRDFNTIKSIVNNLRIKSFIEVTFKLSTFYSISIYD